MQVLEGEEEAVTETMARIQADDRHNNIYPRCSNPVEAREFGGMEHGLPGPHAPRRGRMAGVRTVL